MFAVRNRTTFMMLGSAAGLAVLNKPVISNETKRRFYENDVNDEEFNIPKKLIKPEESTPIVNKVNVGTAEGMNITSSSFLEKNLQTLRKWTINHLDYYYYEYQTAKSSANNELKSIKNCYNSVVVEPILPNIIYILTGALSGSILVHKKALPLRFITPIIFGTACFSQFMPKSFDNTKDKIWQLEKTKLPNVAESHIKLLIDIEENKQLACTKLKESNQCLISKVHDSREFLKKLLDF